MIMIMIDNVKREDIVGDLFSKTSRPSLNHEYRFNGMEATKSSYLDLLTMQETFGVLAICSSIVTYLFPCPKYLPSS